MLVQDLVHRLNTLYPFSVSPNHPCQEISLWLQGMLLQSGCHLAWLLTNNTLPHYDEIGWPDLHQLALFLLNPLYEANGLQLGLRLLTFPMD